MKILYVTGSCLTKNTSANMSHNGYIQGLLENKAEIDIVMANDSWGEADNKLHKFEDAVYYEYNSVSVSERLRREFIKRMPLPQQGGTETSNDNNNQTKEVNFKSKVRSLLKKLFYVIFSPDPIYPLESAWLKNASKFKGNKIYDLVISNSSPAASHKLVSILLDKKRITCKRWIQIWEDPWYHDLYGGHPDYIENEEHSLLKIAQEIYYVSPLTLQYQKMYFPDCASRMKFIPLPFFKFSNAGGIQTDNISFGYFGDYYSQTRNLQPFYDALCESHRIGYIYGDGNLNLKSYENITVAGRTTLDKLERIQDQTAVLVCLCNLRGGQIPGKIYHYSATEKPILFILDGTEDEKKTIRDFFSKYNRYYFCDNEKTSIKEAIVEISCNYDRYRGHIVDAFSPKNVTSLLID